MVARGVYPIDWAGDAADPGSNFGERQPGAEPT
jgi:putative transposase